MFDGILFCDSIQNSQKFCEQQKTLTEFSKHQELTAKIVLLK